MRDLKKYEDVLRARLTELDGRMHRLEDHLELPPERDWEDDATEAGMDEVLEGLGQSGLTEMEAIHAALARIKGGSYGVYVSCGNDISRERLDVVAHTALCRKCATAATEASALGLPVKVGMPLVVIELMKLSPRPVQSSSVECLSVDLPRQRRVA